MQQQAPAHEIEIRFAAAIDYAVELLADFLETTEAVSVATLLDSLTDEYWKARQERRGMDPALVCMVVQGLIDAASFPPGNRPDEVDTETAEPAALDQRPPIIFRYASRRGRKPLPPIARDALGYTLGAVMGHFGLSLYRNHEPALHKPLDGETSACDAVAQANRRLGRTPATYKSVEEAILNHPFNDTMVEEGRLRGAADRNAVPAK